MAHGSILPSMSHPLLTAIHLPVPCPACGKKSLKGLDELILNNRVPCGVCGTEIDITSEGWRTAIEELADRTRDIRKLPPVGD